MFTEGRCSRTRCFLIVLFTLNWSGHFECFQWRGAGNCPWYHLYECRQPANAVPFWRDESSFDEHYFKVCQYEIENWASLYKNRPALSLMLDKRLVPHTLEVPVNPRNNPAALRVPNQYYSHLTKRCHILLEYVLLRRIFLVPFSFR